MSEKSLDQRIAEKIHYINDIGSFYRREINKVLAEAGSPPISQLGTPLCLDVEYGAEIDAFGAEYPDMVAAEPMVYDPSGYRNEDVVTATLAEIGKGVTVIREYAGAAIKSLPLEKKFGLVTWFEIFPDSFRDQEYFLSVAAMAMEHLTEGGVMVASAAEEDRETKNIFAKTAQLISEKVPAATAKYLETPPRGIGSVFIVARKNSGG
ncbi:MAG: hypothetical protein HY602_03470 [Parcubacteria group bacterium]|nr:hypothetical protein [Parcubacteria group bacterium]